MFAPGFDGHAAAVRRNARRQLWRRVRAGLVPAFALITLIAIAASVAGCGRAELAHPKHAAAGLATPECVASQDGRFCVAQVSLVTLADGTRCAVVHGRHNSDGNGISCSWGAAP